MWIRRTQVYRSLVRYHDGQIQNRGNLKRTARRCGIERCFELTMEDILLRLKVCLDRCDHYRKNGKHYRRKHLNDCLSRARDMEDSAKEKEILEIIQREKDRSFWRRINWSMGKARNGSERLGKTGPSRKQGRGHARGACNKGDDRGGHF